MTADNANAKQLRAAAKAAALAESNRIAYTRKIMSDLFGRAWMYDLLLRANVFHTPFVAGGPDITAFNCGAQNLGLRLFGDVAAHCPHEYSLMMTEASTKEAANDRRNSESASGTDTGSASGPRRNPASTDASFTVDAEGFVIDTTGAEDPDARPEDASTRSLEDA